MCVHSKADLEVLYRQKTVHQPARGAARSETVQPQVVKLSFKRWEFTDTVVVTRVSEDYLQLERPTSDHLHLQQSAGGAVRQDPQGGTKPP